VPPNHLPRSQALPCNLGGNTNIHQTDNRVHETPLTSTIHPSQCLQPRNQNSACGLNANQSPPSPKRYPRTPFRPCTKTSPAIARVKHACT
jgi:hypothetical protein